MIILSLLLFIISLFAIVKAPTNLLWRLSVGVIEWGQYFAFISIVLLLFSLNNRLLILINSLSILLFLSTTIKAVIRQRIYEEGVLKAFPTEAHKVRKHTISFKELFAGISYKEQIPVEYEFDIKHGLKLDYYRSSHKNAPCIIAVHGGSWSSGDRKMLPQLNSYLADKGYAVVAISYRLAPESQYPTQIADVLSAVRWVKQHANEFGIDSTRLIMLGRSAGAQLAQQATYTNIDKDIKGVISFYCPADLVWGYSVPGNPLIMDSRKVLDQFIGATAFERQDLYEAASPAYHVSPSVPPTLLLHGRPDVMVAWEHSGRMNEKFNDLGIKHYFVDLPWATHGYDFAFNGPSSQISLFAIEHFLANVCKSSQFTELSEIKNSKSQIPQ